MASTYTLKIVTDFAAAHSLRDYPGACSRLHGHNWKIEVQVCSTQLDEVGMVLDFKKIKSATKSVAAELDHQYLNEIAPFDVLNPTAENIAAHFFRCLSQMLNDGNVKVKSVTIWETERASATYAEE